MSDHLLNRLPLEIWFIIFSFMAIPQLQILSTISKSARLIVIKYPVLYCRNMLDHFSRLYEIERTSARRLKITNNLKNELLVTKVFQTLPHLQSILICAPLNRKTIQLLLKLMVNYKNIHEIVVPEYDLSRWQKIMSRFAKRNNNVKIIAETVCQDNCPKDTCSITQNPLLLGVNHSEIPLPLNSTPEDQQVLHGFNLFRNDIISKLSYNTYLNTIEEALSFNGIMMFSETSFSQYKLSHNLITYAKDDFSIRLAEVNYQYDRELSGMINAFIENPTEAPFESFAAAANGSSLFVRVLSLITSLSENIEAWDTNKMIEDTFYVNSFDLFSNAFIRTIPDTLLHGRDHQVHESKERKMKLAKLLGKDTCVRGRKPDRSLSVSVGGHLHHVLLCELKTEKGAKKRGDVIKLGSVMKDCLDSILYRGFDRKSFYVVGILQEGKKSTLFTMNSPFNFFYRMIDVYSCEFPNNKGSLSLLKETVIFFSFARTLVENVVKKLNNLNEYKTDDCFDNWLGCQSPKTHDLYLE